METKTLDNGLTFETREIMRVVAKHRLAGRNFEAMITFNDDRQWHIVSETPHMSKCWFPSLEQAVEHVKNHHQTWLDHYKNLFDHQSEFDAEWQRFSEG